MDDTDKTRPSVPVVGLSKKAIVKSIQQRRDEYHVTIATLLGCELAPWSAALLWRYKTPSGLGMAYTTAAHAARAWLTENNHDLDGWCENDEARTHGEESNPAGN